MKFNSEIQKVLVELYAECIEWSRLKKQTIGKYNDYYVTLSQLEALMKKFLPD